jgi:hypothetical protein
MDVEIIKVEPKRDLIEVTVLLSNASYFRFQVRTKAEMEAKIREMIANLAARDQALEEIVPGPVTLTPVPPSPDAKKPPLEALREELAVLIQEEALGVPQPEVLAAKRAAYVAIRDAKVSEPIKEGELTKS